MTLKKIFKVIKHHFGFPVTINWGYSLFLCSLGLLIVYILRSMAISKEFPLSFTSLMGYALTMPLLVALALVAPAAILFIDKKKNKANVIIDSVGHYTGIGPMLLSFISGIGIFLIKTPIHNLFTWLWLRMGRSLIFPSFFFVNTPGDVVEKIAGYFFGTVIPSFGIAIFFTGLMWACFRKKDKKIAAIIVAFFFAVFSLNFIDFIALFIVGIWLCFLRDRTGNIWSPFVALLGAGLTDMFFSRFVKSVDITMVQVHSDIDSTYFYSSMPAFLVGVILLAFFAKTLNDFKASYDTDVSINGEESSDQPSIISGVNLSLICAIIIFLTMWVIYLKG